MTYISQFRRVRGYRLSDINNHPITNWLYYQPVGYCEYAPRQLSYCDVDHKRISCLRATDYSEDINYIRCYQSRWI